MTNLIVLRVVFATNKYDSLICFTSVSIMLLNCRRTVGGQSTGGEGGESTGEGGFCSMLPYSDSQLGFTLNHN